MSLPDVLVGSGHMFLHFQNLVAIVDEHPPSLGDIIPGIPEEGELSSPHLFHTGHFDSLGSGEVIDEHSVEPGFIDLLIIGKVGEEVNGFHITVGFFSYYKDTTKKRIHQIFLHFFSTFFSPPQTAIVSGLQISCIP